jgi:hypothetical protein
MKRPFPTERMVGCLVTLATFGFAVASEPPATSLRADEQRVSTAQAPPRQDVLQFAGGGVYYVAKSLKERRDRLIEQLQSLKTHVDEADISGDEALKRLASLKSDLESLQKQLDENKMFVTPFKKSTQTDTVTFDLGAEKLVVITADDVRVESWAGPDVKCFLEKTVFTAGDEPAEPQLKALAVVHERGHFPNIVGRTVAETEADVKKFLDSPEGSKLSPAVRASRKAWMSQIDENYAIFRAFQGKGIDRIGIKGTEYEQNRSIAFQTTSEGGAGMLGSTRQRHVKLTVFLPPCNAVALRGCMVGLHVQGLKTSLVVVNTDSRDRDFEGRFEILDHVGPIQLQHVPIQKIDHVQGDVRLMLTDEFSGGGTTSQGDWRILFPGAPQELVCSNITGGFSAWCGRISLKLAGLVGPIDVRNEFGDTVVTLDPSTPVESHRVVSESGRIDAIVPRALLNRLDLFAATSHGNVETNAGRDLLEELLISTSGPELSVRRDWHEFLSKSAKESLRRRPDLSIYERVALALAGKKRVPGFDFISRGGTVAIKIKK